MICSLCPHACHLSEGKVGACRARIERAGKILPLALEAPCALALDPMEKKPLFHFFPGEAILSIGTAGCNLHCKNCQNAELSQHSPRELPSRQLTPQQLVSILKQNGLRHVAYTYNEPLVAFEYVLACAQAVKEAGGTNTLVTAAYFTQETLSKILPFIDAANVDLKAMDDEFYKKNCGAGLAPVLDALRLFASFPITLEVTNLVIPHHNDTEEDIRKLAHFVARELGTEVPLHFSRFFPRHLLAHLPVTPEQSLEQAKEIALDEGLKHVYRGNSSANDATNCAQCGRSLIMREGYRVIQNTLTHGACPYCGKTLYGKYE